MTTTLYSINNFNIRPWYFNTISNFSLSRILKYFIDWCFRRRALIQGLLGGLLRGLRGSFGACLGVSLGARIWPPKQTPQRALKQAFKQGLEQLSNYQCAMTKTLILGNEMLYLVSKNHVITYYNCWYSITSSPLMFDRVREYLTAVITLWAEGTASNKIENGGNLVRKATGGSRG